MVLVLLKIYSEKIKLYRVMANLEHKEISECWLLWDFSMNYITLTDDILLWYMNSQKEGQTISHSINIFISFVAWYVFWLLGTTTSGN
jgi:hypothetical protein